MSIKLAPCPVCGKSEFVLITRCLWCGEEKRLTDGSDKEQEIRCNQVMTLWALGLEILRVLYLGKWDWSTETEKAEGLISKLEALGIKE